MSTQRRGPYGLVRACPILTCSLHPLSLPEVGFMNTWTASSCSSWRIQGHCVDLLLNEAFLLSLWGAIFQVGFLLAAPSSPRFHLWPLVRPTGHMSKPNPSSWDQCQSCGGVEGCEVGKDPDRIQVLFRKHLKRLMLSGLTALHSVHIAFACGIFSPRYFSLICHSRRNPPLGDITYCSE